MIVWCSTGARWRLAIGVVAWAGLTLLDTRFVLGGYFLIRDAPSGFEPGVALLEDP